MSEKTLQIPFLREVHKNTSISEVSGLLDQQKRNPVDIEPWPDYPEYFDVPKVWFNIAHGGDNLFIKYDVTEHEVLARYKQINDPVYKDSCVEFFIAFDDKGYYNVEFNRLGTCLASFGAVREDRTRLSVDLLKTIKYERGIKQITNTSEPAINWTLTVAVPVAVFSFHHLATLRNKKARMNFFKCGDDLSQPHYLAWNNITSPAPDFHLPQFFGGAEFA